MGMREGITLSKGFEICFLVLQYGSAMWGSFGFERREHKCGNATFLSLVAYSSSWGIIFYCVLKNTNRGTDFF